MAGKMIDNAKSFMQSFTKFNTYALFCHIHPDGDSVGSAVAMQLILRSLGKTVDIYCHDEIPEKFKYVLKEIGEIKSGNLTQEYDALVAIDVSSEDRIGATYLPYFAKHKNTFCIDHHITNPGITNCNYIKDVSSNTQNILQLAKAHNVPLNKDIATAIYMGLIADTGNFVHSNTNPQVFLDSAEVVKYGVDCNKVYYYVFGCQSKNRAKMHGLTMSKIEYYLDGRFAVIAVSAETIKNCGAQNSDTSGFIDFIMQIQGVEVGACLMESSLNTYRCSLRSKKADVSKVASYFGGGGHTLASGCTISGFLYDNIEKLVKLVKEELDA